jgi:hypothetical protein
MDELNNGVVIQIFIKLSVEPRSQKNEMEAFDESSNFVVANSSSPQSVENATNSISGNQ